MSFGLYIQLRLKTRAQRDIEWFVTRCRDSKLAVVEKTICEDAVVVATGHLHSAYRYIGVMLCFIALGLVSLFVLPPMRPSVVIYQRMLTWFFIAVMGVLVWDGLENLRSRGHFQRRKSTAER